LEREDRKGRGGWEGGQTCDTRPTSKADAKSWELLSRSLCSIAFSSLVMCLCCSAQRRRSVRGYQRQRTLYCRNLGRRRTSSDEEAKVVLQERSDQICVKEKGDSKAFGSWRWQIQARRTIYLRTCALFIGKWSFKTPWQANSTSSLSCTAQAPSCQVASYLAIISFRVCEMGFCCVS
jgi:hypothetical protein